MTEQGLFTEVLEGGNNHHDLDRGPRLVLSHGFTQNGRCWGGFEQALATQRSITLVDGAGHGRSNHDQADLWDAAELLIQASPQPGPNVHIGYSMGGRVALHAALSNPEAVSGLVLIAATAGIVDATDRAERRAADEALADQLEAHGLESFLDGWLAKPLFAGLPEAATAREARGTNRVEGLAESLRHCGTGTQEPLWGRLKELTMPVLMIVGVNDTKFATLADEMVQHMGSTTADVVRLPGGHAVHLQSPVLTAKTIFEWLSVSGLTKPTADPA